MSRLAAIAFRIALVLAIWPAWAHTDEEDPLRYRRVEVPQDRVEEFVSGMLPLPRGEFESLVVPETKSLAASFESATYTAKLEGKQLIQGTALLVVSDGRDSSDGQLLTIGGNLAMTDAQWRRQKSSFRAVLGNRDGDSAVLVDPLSKELEFRWSQHGETRDKTHYFDVRFPGAFVQELLLEVPANLNVVAPGVLVERQVAESIEREVSDTTIWSIRWSGRSRIQFAATPQVDTAATASIDSLYRITESDLRLQSQIELVGSSNTAVLALTVDPMLTVTNVTAGGSSTLFTLSETLENTVLIELPTLSDSQLESAVTLQIEAIGRLPMNSLQSLPRVRPQCDWKKETVQCRMDDSITVADLKLQRCECRFLRRMESSGGEWFAFDLKSEAADIQLLLERRGAEFSTESITIHRLQENSLLAESEVKFQPLEGELFDLEIDVETKQGWSVKSDSIQVFSESDLIRSSLLIDTPQIADGTIFLRLREAATTERPISVRFQLQNNSLAAKPTIAVPQLNPVRFPNSSEDKSWIYIKDTPGVEISTNGSEHGGWQTIDSADTSDLPTWIRQRTEDELVPSDKDLFIRYGTGAALVQVARKSEQSLPTVKSKTQIEFNDHRSLYALEIEVDPLGKEMNNLVVTFSNATPGANWSFVGRSEKPVVNREEQEEGLDSHQILFSTIAEPFQLRLEFETNLIPQSWQSIPLSTVADASVGDGIVSLTTEGPLDLDLQHGNELESLPLTSQLSEAETHRLRSIYRYDDTATTPPSLKIQTLSRPAGAVAWAWRTDLRSYYAEEGRPRHRADVFVQTEADTQFSFELPLGFLFEKAEIDGVGVEPSREDNVPQRRFNVTLPASNRHTCVTIKYVEADRTLHPIDQLAPPLPKINLLSMQSTWQIWLPHDYRVYDPDNANSQSWLRRLVGFLATHRGLELEASIVGSIKRKWIAEVDDPMGPIQQIEVLLGADLSLAADGNKDALLRWGPRLRMIADAVKQSRDDFKLYVDREEIRRAGVFADTELPKTSYSSPRQMGIRRLSQSGLVIIVEGKRALITSASEARRQTRPTDWIDEVGADGIVDRFGTSRLLLIDDWIDSEFEELWRPSRDELEIGLQRAGWSPNRNNIDLGSLPVQVYHRDTIVALACSIFCLGFAWGWRLYQTRRRRCLMLCAVAMAAALLLPQPGATLAVAFGWSIFASGLLRFAMRSRRLRGMQEPVLRKLSPTRAASWIVICIALCFGNSDQLAAQELVLMPENTVSEEEKEQFVYFPTNADRNLLDTVYVTPEFYRSIKQQKNANDSPTKFLLTKTKYAGEWPSVGLAVKLSVTLHVTTLSENVLFKLPDFGNGVNLNVSSLRANRKPIVAQTNNGSVAIQLTSAADYRISFDIAAPIERKNNNLRLNMPIPVSPDSAVELRVPRNTSNVDSPSAIGQQIFDEQNHVFSAALGPAPRLEVAVAGPISSKEEANSNLPSIEQTTWVKVDGNKVELFVRFDFEDEAFGLQVGIDPRLVPTDETERMFQWNQEDSTLSTEFAPASTMHFEFERDETRRFEIPAIIVRNANVIRNRLAVSTGSQTNVRIDDEEVESLPPESFLGEWEDADEKPDLYVQVTDELPEIEVIELPLVEDWSSDVSYFFDQIETRVEVKSQLVPQYDTLQVIPFRRIRVPSNLDISRLTAATSLGVPHQIRWRRHEDEVTIFFLDEVMASSNAPIEIAISGTVPTRDLNALSVVEFVSDRADNSSVRNVVHIYRAANVDIILEGSTAPFVPEAVNPDVPAQPGYILHGVWTSETVGFQSSPDALTIRRTTLERNLEGTLTTRLMYDDVWSAEITTVLTSDDDVDAIYFDLPVSLCSQPLVAYEGENELRVDAVTGGSTIGRRMIAVWLPAQESSKRTVQLVARMEQDQTSLPDVRLVNVRLKEVDGQPQRFAELPVESRRERTGTVETTLFNWKLSGLTPVPSSNGKKNYERYRISQSDGTALLDETPANMQAEVLHLHTNIAWRENKSYVAMSEFEVNPASQTQLLLELPADAEVIQVLCDERHTSFSAESITNAKSKEKTLHAFRLNSSPWPQRVRVIYRGTIQPKGSRSFAFRAPAMFYRSVANQLQALSVDEEIWSVSGPRIFGMPTANRTTDRRIDQLEADAIRLDTFTELWSRAQASIRERSREEKTNCLKTWTAYLRDTLDRYENENESQQEIERLMANYPDAFLVDGSKRLPMAELWRESQWTDGEAFEFRSDPPSENELPTCEVTYRRGPLGSWPRYLLALGVLACGVLVPRWNQSSQLLDRAFSEPHAATAVFGVFWWLFLSPYWVGVFLILLALVVWTWSRFRTYHLAIRR